MVKTHVALPTIARNYCSELRNLHHTSTSVPLTKQNKCPLCEHFSHTAFTERRILFHMYPVGANNGEYHPPLSIAIIVGNYPPFSIARYSCPVLVVRRHITREEFRNCQRLVLSLP